MSSLDDILEHHGIKGMRWGVRNRRSAVSSTGQQSQPHATTSKESKQRAQSWGGKYQNRDKMSTTELRSSVERLRLENEFGRLSSQASESTKSAGRQQVKKVSGQILSSAATAVAAAAVSVAISKAKNKYGVS